MSCAARHRLPLGRALAGIGWALGAGIASLGLQAPVPAADMPPPPPPRQVLYDPDPAVCKPVSLQSSFQQQLLPWADQPAAVQARLRQVQLEMLHATLQRCLSKGLLSPEEAGSLEKSLGQGGPEPIQPSGARP